MKKLLAAFLILSFHIAPLPAEEHYRKASQSSRASQKAFRHCWRYMHGWLAHREERSGLLPHRLKEAFVWKTADSAADNFPFLVLTASLLEPEIIDRVLLPMLRAEMRLTNRLDRLPDDFDLETHSFRYPDLDLERLIFGGSEYVKDGLIPVLELLGETPWSERMTEIVEDIWKHAPVETGFGKIPSRNVEVNGEQLQILCRLYWKTGDELYRKRAFRLADHYLLRNLPTTWEQLKLDDHGCEIIGGLAGAYYLASHVDPARKKRYQQPIHSMLERILEVGTNQDGLIYELVNPRTGEVLDSELSDNWGYDYNAVLNVAEIDQKSRFRTAVTTVLNNIHLYRDYPWEGGGADGYADAIEGALNLLNRIPVRSGFSWVDDSTRTLLSKQREDGIIEGWYGDGNFARTALMYALWKTQGTRMHPWRADLAWGAAREGEVLYLSLKSDWRWRGRLIFDIPRHREFLNLPSDYPRINQFPEWFTVDEETIYEIRKDGLAPFLLSGRELRSGLTLETEPGKEVRIRLTPIK